MKKLMLPLLLTLLGTAGGGAAGWMMYAPPEPEEVADVACPEPEEASSAALPAQDAGVEFVKLSNQFVIPVVKGGRVRSLIVLAMTIEVEAGNKSGVFEREPKLRDGFNEALFLHANTGGFDGVFTEMTKMNALRLSLQEVAQAVLGPWARQVLITDIVRQDN